MDNSIPKSWMLGKGREQVSGQPVPQPESQPCRPTPSYAPESIKSWIHGNSGSKSSLHLRGAVEPFEPPGKCQPEPVQQRLLLGLRLRRVAQSDRSANAAC